MSKNRLDSELFERGLAESREKAKSLIMAGRVQVNGTRADKAGSGVKESDEITVSGDDNPYVSRGGLKLEKALSVFPADVYAKTAVDVGASTGGFTDCLLQHGAKKVYAIDTGYGQLAYKLRTDERVEVFEKTNFRYMNAGTLEEKAGAAVMDVSFISVLKLAENLLNFLQEEADCIFLIKPQFETGREDAGKKGVVTDPEIHKKVLRKVISGLSDFGYCFAGLDFSPVKGPKGNIEFLAYFKAKSSQIPAEYEKLISETADKAHEVLK